MYFDEPMQAFERPAPEVRAVIVLSGMFTLFFVLFAQPFVALAGAAAHALF